eukprot:3316561-Rhodomonas_salina.1
MVLPIRARSLALLVVPSEMPRSRVAVWLSQQLCASLGPGPAPRLAQTWDRVSLSWQMAALEVRSQDLAGAGG